MSEPKDSLAKRLATECQSLARQLGNHQNDKLELPARDVQKLTTTLLNAGNVMAAIDKIDPMGPPPAGWQRTSAFDGDGRLTIMFVQVDSTPPPAEYGHPTVQ
jgi:hypothetical protein